ncbi:MAG: hypothetical protein RLZZ330_800 [Actinomycetota bacterium]|jgi:hypothetical protein
MGILALSTKEVNLPWAQTIHFDSDAADYMQVSAICKAIEIGDSRGSHVVAFKGIARHLPALQVYFRTNHFRVLSYVCIDELPTGKFVEWPDAPVVYVDTTNNEENLNIARLRNWQIVSTNTEELQSAITSCVELYE